MHYTPENLKNYLKENGITRQQLAEKFGVSKRAVDKWCAPWESQDHRDMPARKWDELMETSASSFPHFLKYKKINQKSQEKYEKKY